MRRCRCRCRCLAAGAVLAGSLAAPAAAPAKEVAKVAVCGAQHACVTYDRSDFRDLMFLVADAGPTDPPASPAPWYRVRFTVDEGPRSQNSWTVAYVPSAHALRVQDGPVTYAWHALQPRTDRVFARAASRLDPLRAAELRGVGAEPVRAKVDEVVAPASAGGGGGVGWMWPAAGALVVAAAVLVVRRRRFGGVAPGPAR